MVTLLLLVPWGLLSASQVIAAAGSATQLRRRRLAGSRARLGVVAFAAAALAGVAALVVALRGLPAAYAWCAAAALATCAAPMLWASVDGELDPRHHVVRVLLVVACGVLYCSYVMVHR